MVIDKLTNAKQYYGISKRIEVSLKYLENTDLKNLELGKHEIDGKNIIVIVSEYETKNLDEGKWEAHRKYIDIQYVVSGKEKIGYASINEMKMIGEYNQENDVLFLEGEGDLSLVNEGTFAIYAPQDVHMPGISVNNGQHVKKIVVKILV